MLDIPENLSVQGKAAVEVIIKRVRADQANPIGLEQAFCSAQDWADRGEKYGLKSELIIIHDGGDLGPYFSYDRENYNAIEKMDKDLHEIGMYAQQCTRWYTAIYKL